MTAVSFIAAIRRAGLAIVTVADICTPALAQEAVLIPNRVIYPGETITAGALRQVKLVPGKVKPDAVATTLPELDGKVARRTLLPGRYIPSAAVRSAWLIEQGASVQVYFITGGLTISATAVTLQAGAPGDMVRVRNVDSGKVLTGTVMEDGTVRVGT
ncbi:flagellar basal body P-ring formation chaperone FlgA [Aquamicrobium defluvii]|uniref:Flagella basal body P-ring formation protein FlgA n=1 Tax=Aquamicrobium defluvii TaxID=69279 RepID=A0A011UUH3_9HYPH|nr:flagellar basal body P-ring formation chaperone FlgA [Aquamicrobium defluvii]EXL09508.1 flagellar basal body P-ring biosynthesis protein FlgA [Aquamicrobium defluvii]EZQ16458.1 flagellar basal body P-ring biosynthesis protein FlgA [Halopseudomonas bauzanensis]TDR34251.1 flagella basal body P-ring formation protein FlgA [Aquamicrobium defluvii]